MTVTFHACLLIPRLKLYSGHLQHYSCDLRKHSTKEVACVCVCVCLQSAGGILQNFFQQRKNKGMYEPKFQARNFVKAQLAPLTRYMEEWRNSAPHLKPGYQTKVSDRLDVSAALSPGKEPHRLIL
jgi:hypothetical protein